ncbi:MAG: hypothetical protein LBL00_07225, partial [Endomicrobium sp.]|nr:hypothetical protein [Endomicrobium sp.]
LYYLTSVFYLPHIFLFMSDFMAFYSFRLKSGVKTSRGRLLRNNSISKNFGHDDKNDFTRLSFPKVFIGNPFCLFAFCRQAICLFNVDQSPTKTLGDNDKGRKMFVKKL